MDGFSRPWFVAGGWALDLFLGHASRLHADIEVALFREDQYELRRHLTDWEFEKVAGGERTSWAADEWLPAPVHEIHGRQAQETELELEFLLNERRGDEWVYRRNPAIRRSLDEIGGRAFGMPFLRPEIVLLYKAKLPRAVDEQDLDAVIGSLDAKSRAWLAAALAACHPGHRWLDILAGRKPY